MSPGGLRSLALLLIALLGLGCAQSQELTPDFDAGADGFGFFDATPNVDAAPDAALDAPKDAPAVEAGASGACQCGSPACGSCPTTVMVAAGGYGIDATEVTNDAYAAYLATNPDPKKQPLECAENTSLLPASGWPPAVGKGSDPVVHVDHCDARAYCKWAKKRLCGKIAGGILPYADFSDAKQSQWHNACSGGGTKTFPYGAQYAGSSCNGADYGASAPIAVGSASACEGGYPGLFDMSGNVWEWEDACNGTAGAADLCRIRGGSHAQNATALGCAADSALPRSGAGKSVGFRCCE